MDARVLIHADTGPWGAPTRQSVLFQRIRGNRAAGKAHPWQLEESGCLSSQHEMGWQACSAVIDLFPAAVHVQVERGGLRFGQQWLKTVTMQYPGDGIAPGVMEAMIQVLPAASFGVLDVQRQPSAAVVCGLTVVLLHNSREAVDEQARTLVADLFGVQGMLASLDSPRRSLLQLTRLHPSSGACNLRMVQGVELLLTGLFPCASSA